MSFGIDELKGNVYCANCKKIVAKTGNEIPNYCSYCGSPLTPAAIKEIKNERFLIKRDVIRRLNEISKQNKNDSLVEILSQYIDEIDE